MSLPHPPGFPTTAWNISFCENTAQIIHKTGESVDQLKSNNNTQSRSLLNSRSLLESVSFGLTRKKFVFGLILWKKNNHLKFTPSYMNLNNFARVYLIDFAIFQTSAMNTQVFTQLMNKKMILKIC